MKIIKRIVIVFAVMFICFKVISYCFYPEREIKNFVNKNYLELEEIANDYLVNKISVKEYKGVEIEGVFKGDTDIVQFYYSGFGIAPASTYYGFYYSPNDIVVMHCNSQDTACKLVNTKDNEYEWSCDESDNGGRILKIRDYWYYYEAWY
ncbi:MAG: hypothetical protein IKM20_10330 [Erysipelotrichales bacterium]|nr:hypothetical protein [Erysipelotrichales bacterium]